MSKVSIIIPVHNSLKTLNDCLFSLFTQTLENIEIIVVDDCSTDETPVLLSAWQEKVPEKLKVIRNQNNIGAGGARNIGIQASTGKYIGFVDSDDKVTNTMFEKLFLEAERTGYDVIDGGYYDESEDKAILHTSDDCTGILDSKKRSTLIVAGGYIWNKLYRRELFEDSKLLLRENCILEDADFLTYLFSTISTMGNVKEILYCYQNQESSLSKESDFKKYHYNICEAMKAIFEKCHSLENYSEISKAIEYEIVQFYIFGIVNCLKAYQGKKADKYVIERMLKELQELEANIIENTQVEGTSRNDIYDNEYVLSKISKEDIEVAKLNDRDVRELVRKYRV